MSKFISGIYCILGAITLLCGCIRSERNNDAKPPMPPIVELCRSFDYSDTAALHTDQTVAEYMKGIVRLMSQSDSASTSSALDIFFDGLNGDPTAIRLVSHYSWFYLNNPNSPVRNEKLFLRFLTSLLSRTDLPEDVSARAEERMRKAMLNRPGTKAGDFRYIDREGRDGTLHTFCSPQTMLIFYDPECPHCSEILKTIATDSKVNDAIDSGALKILAVYAEGKRDVWDRTKQEMPANWSIAYDLTGILDNDIYDLPAMPIVYLLDSDKLVLVKDMAL